MQSGEFITAPKTSDSRQLRQAQANVRDRERRQERESRTKVQFDEEKKICRRPFFSCMQRRLLYSSKCELAPL
jgi:hypothetical protein